MKKIINSLVNRYDETKPGDFTRIIVIDLLTIGVGFVSIMHGLIDKGYWSAEGSTLGSALFITGILINYWRRQQSRRRVVDAVSTHMVSVRKSTAPDIIEHISAELKEEAPEPGHFLEVASPNGKYALYTSEDAYMGPIMITSVWIRKPDGASTVCSLLGAHLDLNAYWKDDSTVVIELKKHFIIFQKWIRLKEKETINVEYVLVED